MAATSFTTMIPRALIIAGAIYVIGAQLALSQTPDTPAPVPKIEDAVPPPKKEVVVEPRAGDQQIAQRLKDILLATGWFENPVVKVRDGVVFLDGEALEEIHRKWAGDLAQSTQDVVAVVNRMEIRREVSWKFEATQKQVNDLYWQIARSLPIVLLGILVLLITMAVAKIVAILARYFLRPRIDSPLLLNVVARAIAIPVLLVGLYIVLLFSNLTRLALTVLGGTGIAGLILGLAFRDITENYLASLVLSFRNPFRMGDYIAVDGSEGIVQNLNTRTTVLLTLDGNHVQIPNAIVFKSKIVNFSSSPNRRSEFSVGIGYDCAISQAQDIILGVLKGHDAVLAEPEPLVLVHELKAATVDLKVYYWFDSTVYSPIKIQSAMLRLTKRALLEAGISMPDDAREIVFPRGVPIVRFDDKILPSTGHLESASPPPSRELEISESATDAEGDLMNEDESLKRGADGSTGLDNDDNLLRDRKPA